MPRFKNPLADESEGLTNEIDGAPEFDGPDSIEQFSEPIPTPKKETRGRPKGSKKKTKLEKRLIEQEKIHDLDKIRDFEVDIASPLFSGPDYEGVDTIGVERLDPEEGHLGNLNAAATEAEIFEKFGGGLYKITAKDSNGSFIKHKKMRIAGDPIFLTTTAQLKWIAARKNLEVQSGIHASKGDDMIDRIEIMKMEQTAKEKAEERARKIETEAWDKKAELEREMMLRREVEETKRRDREDALEAKRREQQAEETAKREQDHKFELERMERKATAEADRIAQRSKDDLQAMMLMMQTQHQQSMELLMKSVAVAPQPSTDPANSMLKALEVFTTLQGALGGGGGGDNDSTMQTVIKNLPQILNGAGTAIGGVVNDVVSTKNAQTPVQPQLKARPQAQAQARPQTQAPTVDPTASTIETMMNPELMSKMDSVVNKLKAEGKDPAQYLSGLADTILQTKKAPMAVTKNTNGTASMRIQK